MGPLETVLSGTTLRPTDAHQVATVEASLPENTPVALALTLDAVDIPVVNQTVDVRQPLVDAINAAWRAGRLVQGQETLPLWPGDVVPAHVTATGVEIRWVKQAVWAPVVMGLLAGLSVAGVLAGVVTLPEAALLFLAGVLIYEIVRHWAFLRAVLTHPVTLPGLGPVPLGDVLLAGGGLILLILAIRHR